MPPAARLVIRRRQNNESLRRSRARRRGEGHEMSSRIEENTRILLQLEQRAARLEAALEEMRRRKRKAVNQGVLEIPGEYFTQCAAFGDPF